MQLTNPSPPPCEPLGAVAPKRGLEEALRAANLTLPTLTCEPLGSVAPKLGFETVFNEWLRRVVVT